VKAGASTVAVLRTAHFARMQVVRLTTELIFAPNRVRKEYGCIAQDDRVVPLLDDSTKDRSAE
jgi:hypothetical protein